jgi:hypothetical protein
MIKKIVNTYITAIQKSMSHIRIVREELLKFHIFV